MLLTPIIAANWKMYKTRHEVESFFTQLLPEFKKILKISVWIAPSFTTLEWAVKKAEGSPLVIGAQNIYSELQGAFTGEISASQVADCGARFVIVGHSERRRLFGESSAVIKKKIALAVDSGLIPLLCVGETLEERKSMKTEEVLKIQLEEVLQENFTGVIAYEPIWAIGTGTSAAPPMIEEAHGFCKKSLKKLCQKGEHIPVLYGGSVTPELVSSLRGTKNVDGALVGGASLEAQSFISIIRGFGL